MNRREISLIAANAAAIAQRERLRQRLDATGERLKFARLSFDARQAVERRITDGAQTVVAQAKDHPFAAGLGVIALITWLFREPLMDHAPRHVRSLIDRITGHPAFSKADLSGGEAAAEPAGADDDTDTPPAANDTDA